MLDYFIFFGLLSAGFLAFIFRPKPNQSDATIALQIKCESPIERRLYDALVRNGYRVETQVRCGPYRIDLTLPGYQIAIECDGKAYHSSPNQKAHDKKKNAYLRQNGWNVLRFSGRQVNGNLSHVLNRIDSKVSSNLGPKKGGTSCLNE